MKKSPHRFGHEIKKAVRDVKKEEYATEPSEMKEKKKKTFLSSPQNIKRSEAKATSKHKHHKTSPADVTFETEPEHIHQEGAHWMQTIQKQTLNAAFRVRKKLQKWRSSKRKK